MAQFPRNFRAKFDIPRKEHFSTWTEGLLSTYPFLRGIDFESGELMRLESDMMVSAILALLEEGVPSYPVHDCLIVKLGDEQKAVEALQAAMLKHYGHQAHLEIEYLSGTDKIVPSSTQEPPKPTSTRISDILNDHRSHEDDELIDEEDMKGYEILGRSIFID